MLLTDVHDDVLDIILDVLYLDHERTFTLDMPPHRGAALIPISMTCKHLRLHACPRIFREVYARRAVWPETICCYFRKIHLDDAAHPTYEDWSLDLTGVIPTLPLMTALTHVTLRIPASPSAELLRAIASAPHLTSLEILDARLDNVDASAFHPLRALHRLAISIGVDRPPDVDDVRERHTVDGIISLLSPTIACFEISGDIIDLAMIANTSWPNLTTFKITGHPPLGPAVHAARVVSLMPRLRTLGFDFTSTVRYHIPPFILCPRTADGLSLASTVPSLHTLTLSNISHPADLVLDQLPPTLSVLHVHALTDPLHPVEYWDAPLRWHPFFPLSAPNVQYALQLRGLTELALTLEDTPSAALVRAVARACPALRTLELQRAMFQRTFKYHEVDSAWDPYIDALRIFTPGLLIFRISLPFNVLDGDAQYRPHSECALYFAQRLPQLRIIGLLYRRTNAARANKRLESWHDFVITRDPYGGSPRADLSMWDIIA